jgi:hypothetical protein
MQLGGSLAKKAFRAKQVPSPRRGGGLGWGGRQAHYEENEYTKGCILSPSRGGRGPRSSSEFWVKICEVGGIETLGFPTSG